MELFITIPFGFIINQSAIIVPVYAQVTIKIKIQAKIVFLILLKPQRIMDNVRQTDILYKISNRSDDWGINM